MNSFFWRWAASTFFGFLYYHRYSTEWDAALNRLLDAHWGTAVLTGSCVRLGDVEVWIENPFYGYGNHWQAPMQFRPAYKTMRRLDSLVWQIGNAADEALRFDYLSKLKDLGK